jgi:hypothetical protein
MKTVFKHWFGALTSAVLGCASADERAELDPTNDDMLGQNEAAYSASFTNTYQFGAQTNAAKFQCDRVSAGQTCMIPNGNQSATWCVDAGGQFTEAQRSIIREVVSEFDEVLSNVGWYQGGPGVAELPPAADGICRDQTNWFFRRGDVSGALSNNIDGYSNVVHASITDLSDGGFGEDPAGNYQRFGQCVATIDMADILNKGANADEERNLLRHATGHTLLACTGFGTQSSAPSPFFARRALMLDESGLPLTVGQQCVASTYDATNNGDFSLTFSNCTTD